MKAVGQLLNRVGAYFNPSTLSGAIDVLVIQQPDGSLRGSPFHARFGKRGVLRPRDNLVDLYVNEQPVSGLVARLGSAGEVYFAAEPPTQTPPPPTPTPPATSTVKISVNGVHSDDNDDSGHFSEPEASGGGGDHDSAFDWHWGQLPRKPPATTASASPSPTPSASSSPASSWSSLVSAARWGGDGGGRRGLDVNSDQQKSIRLTSEQLHLLGLRPGGNRLRYDVTTKYQGTASCVCAVYLWRHDDRLVISDIDGTITRSDVLGQLLPMVGRDWTQPMVVRLFSAVQRNGYRFLYVSSRGLGQSEATRQLLERVSQEGAPLPDGPILLSPVSLFRALHREVIARRPQEFKIPCLRDVRALFPTRPGGGSDSDGPFWAGFGNRPSDAATYAEVGIPADRCFIVNWRGELIRDGGGGGDDGCGCRVPARSYQELAKTDVADHVFPACRSAQDACYSDFLYWRDSPQAIPPQSATDSGGGTKRRRRSSNTLPMCLSEVNFYL